MNVRWENRALRVAVVVARMARRLRVGLLAAGALALPALAIPAAAAAYDDGGHYYFEAPSTWTCEGTICNYDLWQKGEAQYNGECSGCGHVYVYTTYQPSRGYAVNLGYVGWDWGNQGYNVGYTAQYDEINTNASHTIWGWFWYP